MRLVLVLVALTACKASISEGIPELGMDSGVGQDAPADSSPPLGPWGAPTPIDITPVGDDDPSATADLLELYFNRANDIYVTTRESTGDPWGMPVPVDELNSAEVETTPEVSADGLTIYFASARMPTLGSNDIWMATRGSRTAAWSGLTHVVELSSASADGAATQGDAMTILIDTDRAGATLVDIYGARRMTPTGAWQTPIALAELNSDASDGNPMLSGDELTIYFDSNRSGNSELYSANTTGSIAMPTPIAELNSPDADTDPWISPDGRTMYFTSNRDGTLRLWQTTR